MKVRLPKKEKAEVKTYNQAVVNSVILVVVLSMFLYVAIQISRNFSDKVSTQRTQKITDVTYSYLDGYIFTDGAALSFDGDIIHYLVADGEKVGVGQAYAEIYSDTALGEAARLEAQSRLNELSDRIAMLERGLEGGKTVSDLGSISDEISDSYYAYIDAVTSGDLLSADRPGDSLLSSLIDYSAITLSEAAENTLSRLIEEREQLVSSIGGVNRTLVSDRSFTFYRDSDGYEDIFNSNRLDGLSREAFDALTKQSSAGSDEKAGSMVYSSKWQLAIPIGENDYSTFKDSVGSTYTVELLGSSSLSLQMMLDGIISDGEDTNGSYLVFSSFDLSKISGLGRHQSVRITLGSCTGYRIPEGAMHQDGENTGVYILIGNMIEFRRVTVIGRGDGYYIVNTYEKDYEEGAVGSIPYLNINDLIVTSGRDLYDGKLLK